jgi:hypothetical protein
LTVKLKICPNNRSPGAQFERPEAAPGREGGSDAADAGAAVTSAETGPRAPHATPAGRTAGR